MKKLVMNSSCAAAYDLMKKLVMNSSCASAYDLMKKLVVKLLSAHLLSVWNHSPKSKTHWYGCVRNATGKLQIA